MHQSQDKRYPFLTALSIMNSRYGITMGKDDFIENGYSIYKEIGNSVPDEKYYAENVQKDKTIQIQKISDKDDVFIDSITLIPPEGYINFGIKYNSGGTQEATARSKRYDFSGEVTIPYGYTFGISLSFKVDGDSIVILDNIPVDSKVLIKINTFSLDKDGLPTITRKEAQAIAAGVAERYLIREAFSNSLTNSQLQIFKIVKEDSDRLLQNAAIPDQISSADMEKVLDSAYTMDRKFYRHKLL